MTLKPDSPATSPEHSERVARLRELLEQKPESAQRLDDEIARDQKWDTRISMGEKEMWDRAAQAVGVSTSEFVRDVVNRTAEKVLAAAYISE